MFGTYNFDSRFDCFLMPHMLFTGLNILCHCLLTLSRYTTYVHSMSLNFIYCRNIVSVATSANRHGEEDGSGRFLVLVGNLALLRATFDGLPEEATSAATLHHSRHRIARPAALPESTGPAGRSAALRDRTDGSSARHVSRRRSFRARVTTN